MPHPTPKRPQPKRAPTVKAPPAPAPAAQNQRGAEEPGFDAPNAPSTPTATADAELATNVARTIAGWYRPGPGAKLASAETVAALNAEANRGTGTPIELQSPDGRTFTVPASEGRFIGDLVRVVLKREALTRTRLVSGANPLAFLRLWDGFKKDRDPNSPVTFAEYATATCPATVEAADARPAPIKAKPKAGDRPAGRPRLDDATIATYQALMARWNTARAAGTKKAAFILDDPDGVKLDRASTWERDQRRKAARKCPARKPRQALA